MVERIFGNPGKQQTVDLWPGWTFDGNAIFDDSGNRYSMRDVQLSWDACKIVDGYYGRPSNIANLKQELEKRKRLTLLPKVVLCYESPTGTEELVFDLVKIADS